MNDETSIQVVMWLLIAVQTINGLDMPGHGVKNTRKLPAPKMYVAIIVLWSIFGLMVDMGAGRAAKIMAWTALATAVLVGPKPGTMGKAGTTIIGFLKTIAQNYGTGQFGQSQSQQSQQGGTTA